MADKRSAAPIIAAVLLLLLPLLYVGSYCALVQPVPVLFYTEPAGKANSFVMSKYRIGGEKAKWFFWPLEQIDRMVRPKTWQRPEAIIY